MVWQGWSLRRDIFDRWKQQKTFRMVPSLEEFQEFGYLPPVELSRYHGILRGMSEDQISVAVVLDALLDQVCLSSESFSSSSESSALEVGRDSTREKADVDVATLVEQSLCKNGSLFGRGILSASDKPTSSKADSERSVDDALECLFLCLGSLCGGAFPLSLMLLSPQPRKN